MMLLQRDTRVHYNVVYGRTPMECSNGLQ